MPVKNNNFASSFFNKRSSKRLHNFFYSLDCQSGEGLINSLLPELKKTSNDEFEFYLKFILKKCINVNRSFGDAIEFLSIWLEKSPNSLLSQLKKAELKQFFNRTEYDHEGDQWYFPKLLHAFTPLVEKKSVTANEILDYLFETFDFFNIPEIFISEVIGYDLLDKCIGECPVVFKYPLILKMYGFINENKAIDLGFHSRSYLHDEIQADAIKRIKVEPDKQTASQKLIAYLQQNEALFTYPSFKIYNGDNSYAHKPNFRGGSHY